MPRLFTALEIPGSIAMQLSLLQNGLPGARWIDRENLHITLRFIGDVELPQAREIAYALETVKTAPFVLNLDGLDVFSHSKPHSLFAGVSKSEPLTELHAEQERICQRLGHVAEHRKFIPHVTIARIRGRQGTRCRQLSVRHRWLSEPKVSCQSLRAHVITRFNRWRTLYSRRILPACGAENCPGLRNYPNPM